MINFYYPWEEKEKKFSSEGYLESLELAKAAMYCPSSLEARRMLGLGSEELAKLLKVPEQDVWNWESGRGEPTVEQKIAIKKLLEIDKKRINPHEVKAKMNLTSSQFAKLLGISELEAVSIESGRKDLNVYHKLILKKALSGEEDVSFVKAILKELVKTEFTEIKENKFKVKITDLGRAYAESSSRNGIAYISIDPKSYPSLRSILRHELLHLELGGLVDEDPRFKREARKRGIDIWNV